MVRNLPPIAILLSLHPRWAEAILSGTKTSEIRRRVPQVPAGLPMIIYATVPAAAVVGWCRVAQVIRGEPAALWTRVGAESCVAKSAFYDYLLGAAAPGALVVEGPKRLPPMPLPMRPPQSWIWLREENGLHAQLLRQLGLCSVRRSCDA